MDLEHPTAPSAERPEWAIYAEIVATAVVAAVAYGVVHDQFTARICVEYFTVGHPPVFATTDPTLLGLGWGVIATWWVGLLLGVPLATAARWGSWPKVAPRDLHGLIARLLVCMGACALVAGFLGWRSAQSGRVRLLSGLAEAVPASQHHGFIVDLMAHTASYASGFLGGVVVIALVIRRRYRHAVEAIEQANLEPGAEVRRSPLPSWLRATLFALAQVSAVPQFALLFLGFALVFASTGGPSRLIHPAMGGVYVATSVLVGVASRKHQHAFPRWVNYLLLLIALWVGAASLEAIYFLVR